MINPKSVYFILQTISEKEASIITASYRDERRKLKVPGFYLALFNTNSFANEYIPSLREVKVGESSDLDPDGPFQSMEIATQTQWDFIRNRILQDKIEVGVLNPCESKAHTCPVRSFNLQEYADFNALKKYFIESPGQHLSVSIKGDPNATVI